MDEDAPETVAFLFVSDNPSIFELSGDKSVCEAQHRILHGEPFGLHLVVEPADPTIGHRRNDHVSWFASSE